MENDHSRRVCPCRELARDQAAHLATRLCEDELIEAHGLRVVRPALPPAPVSEARPVIRVVSRVR